MKREKETRGKYVWLNEEKEEESVFTCLFTDIYRRLEMIVQL